MARIYGQQEFVRYVNTAGLIDVGGIMMDPAAVPPATGNVVYISAAGLLGQTPYATLTDAGLLSVSILEVRNLLTTNASLGLVADGGVSAIFFVDVAANRWSINHAAGVGPLNFYCYWLGANAMWLGPAGQLHANQFYNNNAMYLMQTETTWTDGAGVGAGTLLNAPVAGNPAKWISIDDNGVPLKIPAWTA